MAKTTRGTRMLFRKMRKSLTLREAEVEAILKATTLKEAQEVVRSCIQDRAERRRKKEKRRGEEELRQIKKSREIRWKKAQEFRTELVERQTNAEKKFKAYLKVVDIKYEFQKIFYTTDSFYIVDFYIPKYNAVFEIDGEYHETEKQKESDSRRTRKLGSLGKKVYRFKNWDVFNGNVEARLREIKRMYEK